MTESNILTVAQNKIADLERKAELQRINFNEKGVKMMLNFANAERKKAGIPPVAYPECQKGWTLNRPKKLEEMEYEGEDDEDEEEKDEEPKTGAFSSTMSKAKKSELVKISKHPVKTNVQVASVERGQRAANYVAIADYIHHNPEVMDRKDYKAAILKALPNIGIEALNKFFTPSNELTHDSVGRLLNFETMTDSEIYSQLRQSDMEIVAEIQDKILEAIRTGVYNGKRVSLAQIAEIAKISGVRLKSLEKQTPLNATSSINKLPPSTIILLAQIVQNIQGAPVPNQIQQ